MELKDLLHLEIRLFVILAQCLHLRKLVVAVPKKVYGVTGKLMLVMTLVEDTVLQW